MIRNPNTAAAGGARAGVLAEEDDDEGAQGGRRCGRAARSPMPSARFWIAGDLYYKDHPSLPTSDLSGSCARACRGERPRARVRIPTKPSRADRYVIRDQGGDGIAPSLRPAPASALCLAAGAALWTAGSQWRCASAGVRHV